MPRARLVLSALLGPPLLVGAGLCALVAGLSQLGRWNQTWDLFTHFAPIYLAIGVAAVLLGVVFTGRWRIAVLSAGVACVFAAGLLMAPEYLRSAGPKAAAGAGPTFKIVQFNAWDDAGGTGRLAAWLDAERPDVVVVAEANRRIRQGLARHGWWSVAGRSGVMLFTRARPVATILPSDNASGPMELIGVVLATPVGKATVLGLHAPWPTQRSLSRERKALLPIVRSYPAATTILAGDFNSTPWSFARRRDDRDFGLIRRTRAVFTWPVGRHHVPFPLVPIDHVYAGSAWATVRVERGPALGSDHYPVVVTLVSRFRSSQAPAGGFGELRNR
jgi:endonuclease/exonuclease/phosphatase (EEP) superfamily protein YafD